LKLEGCSDFELPSTRIDNCGFFDSGTGNERTNLEIVDSILGHVGSVVTTSSGGDGMHIAGSAQTRALNTSGGTQGGTSVTLTSSPPSSFYPGKYLFFCGIDANTGAETNNPPEFHQISSLSGDTVYFVGDPLTYNRPSNEQVAVCSFDIAVDSVIAKGNSTQQFALESGILRISIGSIIGDAYPTKTSVPGMTIQGLYHNIGRIAIHRCGTGTAGFDAGLQIRSDGTTRIPQGLNIGEIIADYNGTYGVHIYACKDSNFGLIDVRNNNQGISVGTFPGLFLENQTVGSTVYVTYGNTFGSIRGNDDQSTQTQDYAIGEEKGDFNHFVSGNFFGNLHGAISSLDGANSIVRDSSKFNPVGQITNPFGTMHSYAAGTGSGTTVNTIGPFGGTASGPTSTFTYYAATTDLIVNSSGTNVQIMIRDPSGKLVMTAPTLTAQRLPRGYSITFAWSVGTGPTVTVFGE
jgi:hypothetical protein